jgi:hypothetical protein
MRLRLTDTIVRGTPISAEGRVFVPEARVTTFAGREIAMSANGSQAFGLHVRHVRPTALIEQIPGGERRHPIGHATRRAWIGYALAANVPLVLYAIVNSLLKAKRFI